MSQKSSNRYRKRSEGPILGKVSFVNAKEKNYVVKRIEALCEELRTLRKKKGVSQEKLAELTSISLSTIKFIEQGQRVPSLSMFFKILYALDRQAVFWK